ncbi:diguanylate cyclase [Lutibacter sp. B2]|nr:diguanylate cyclase [Lutibacter sp. B2]
MGKIKSCFNSLGLKVGISLLLVGIIPMMLFLFFNNIVVSKYFSEIEAKNILFKTQQVNKRIQSKSLELERVVKDYAMWDDTYEKIQQKDEKWIKKNFLDGIPNDFDIDLIVIANKDKKIVAEYGLGDNDVLPLLEDKMIDQAFKEDIYNENDNFKGIKEYNGDLYMVAFSPIFKSNHEGVSRGVIIFGKKITPKFLKEIERQLGYNVFFVYDNKFILNDGINAEIRQNIHIISKIKGNHVIELGKTRIIGSTYMKDISDEKVGYVGTIESRDIFFSSVSFVRRNTFGILLLSLSLIFIISSKLKNNIINPIKNLEKQITKISEEKLRMHVNVNGPNEIIHLGTVFNKMIDSLFKHKRENENLRNISNTDELTLLYNHRYFYECLNKSIGQGMRPITILFCDIDKFKSLNDIHGYNTGDIILKEIGNIIKETVKNSEFIFRYGGEEYVVLLENCLSEQSLEIAEKIRVNVMRSKKLKKNIGYRPITISVGVATYPFHALGVEDLVEKANKAMCFAKQNGRNQCHIYKKDMDDLVDKNYYEFEKQEMLMDSALALAAAIDVKDEYTGKHSELVAKYSLLLAEKLNLSEQDQYVLRIGALLHDCGKIGIPNDILRKPGKLTDEEFEIIKNHTILGNNIIKYVVKNSGIVSCVRNHHERWDGRGYPDGLSEEYISLYARIVCIADTYHAMTSDRSYRNGLHQEQAFEELRKNKGTQFDPNLVDIFIQTIYENTVEKKL